MSSDRLQNQQLNTLASELKSTAIVSCTAYYDRLAVLDWANR
jgi:hypothetical protein